jgi:taurine dioxygenase
MTKEKAFSVRKLTPLIGAELDGFDLSRTLDDHEFRCIHEAFLQNLVIFFRDQSLTPEQHKALGLRFGDLHLHPAPLGVLPGHPEIMVVKADEKTKRIAGEVWHSDVSCDVEPPMASILHIMEAPPVGGDTLFASMYAAHDALSDRMQRFLIGLTAIHDGERNYNGRAPGAGRGGLFPHAEHPVVRTHPETGRKALFVNRMFTTRIVQLTDWESEIVLRMLYSHVERPEFQCRFPWRPNSVAFWDNRCVQHMALWDYYPGRRYGHRVTIAGDKPFY